MGISKLLISYGTNSIKAITDCALFLLLFCSASILASRPGPAEQQTFAHAIANVQDSYFACPSLYTSKASSSTQIPDKEVLDPDALTHLIIDRDSSGIPIELWEEIILPYVGIDGPLKTICQSKHMPFTELKGHTKNVFSAQFNHNNTQVITTSADNTAHAWNSATGKRTRKYTFPYSRDPIISTQLNQDNSQIVTVSRRGIASIWNNSTGTLMRTLDRRTGLHSAKLNHDGTQMVTASKDVTAHVWDTSTGNPIHALIGHTYRINSAKFNHNGTQIVTASNDHTARTWDAKTGTPLHTFTGHTSWVNSARFNHGSTQIVTASWDKTARIWHLPNTKPTLNQMILLLALEQAKKNNYIWSKTTLAKLSTQYNVPEITLRKVFATFSPHDQQLIKKTFNFNFEEKK